MKKKRYEVVRGLNYGPDGRRAGPGSVLDDLPDDAIASELESGAIVGPVDKPVNRIDDTAAPSAEEVA